MALTEISNIINNLGGTLVIALWWTPLGVMFILHIISLVFASREGKPKAGNILGIVTSCLAWIPILGMILHIVTAIVLYATFFRKPASSSSFPA